MIYKLTLFKRLNAVITGNNTTINGSINGTVITLNEGRFRGKGEAKNETLW